MCCQSTIRLFGAERWSQKSSLPAPPTPGAFQGAGNGALASAPSRLSRPRFLGTHWVLQGLFTHLLKWTSGSGCRAGMCMRGRKKASNRGSSEPKQMTHQESPPRVMQRTASIECLLWTQRWRQSLDEGQHPWGGKNDYRTTNTDSANSITLTAHVCGPGTELSVRTPSPLSPRNNRGMIPTRQVAEPGAGAASLVVAHLVCTRQRPP